ncbi:unnamed protein product [Miscanthus lutarioriparius]|uniref:HAT C-terminal dimerisation domain-containing protein n=1 Tax=Miscanthus lutarioriparius TaxID=422564 RepID=A0A811PML8_9POAL|nr:unnamed protein product [Miscanthus lutarioriparius]
MCFGGTSTGRTTHLRRHLKICPARPATGRMQQQRSSPHPGSTVENIWKFDQDRSLELLIKALVSNLFSSPLTSSPTFRQFWAGICPTNDVVPQRAIEEKFLSIFQNEKLKLQEEIALAPSGVFLTAASSSLETKYFIFLTVHFIDKEWNLNRKIIRCCFTGCQDFDAEYFVSMVSNLQSCHNFINGNVRAAEEEIVKEVVQNWRIEWKLLGISSPRSLGDAAVSALEKNLTEQNYLLAKYALNDLFGYEIKEYVFNNEMPNPQLIDSRSYPAKPSFAQLKAAENFCDLEAFGSHAKRYISEVRGKLYELFLQYSCHVDQQNDESFDQRTNDLQLDTHGNIPVHDASQNYIEQAAHEELGEVIRYLEGELIPQNANFNILKWWKENASIYPTLARLARDILAIPGSAVSAESAFDETDERTSLFNRKLSPELVEALICTQDWIKSSETISQEVGGNINMPA